MDLSFRSRAGGLRVLGFILALCPITQAWGEKVPEFLTDPVTVAEHRALLDHQVRFRQEVLQALETKDDRSDDDAIIRKMMSEVTRPVVNPETGVAAYAHLAAQARAYRESIILLKKRGDSELEALDMIFDFRQALPLHRWFREVPPFELYEQWYEQAPKQRRRAFGHDFVGLLADKSYEAEKAGDQDAAIKINKRALSCAREVGSSWEPILSERDANFSRMGREAERIQQYAQRVEEGRATDDVIYALCLWTMLVDGDTPRTLELLERIKNPALVKPFEGVDAEIKSLGPAEALELAKRFEAMAEDRAIRVPLQQANALRRAKLYYERYLVTYTVLDIDRSLNQQAYARLDKRIQELVPTTPPRAEAPWYPITGQLLYPGCKVAGESIEIRDGSVLASASRFRIPTLIDGGYDLMFNATLKRQAPATGITVLFPIDYEHAGLLCLNMNNDLRCYVPGLVVLKDIQDFRFPRNRPVTIQIKVRPLPDDFFKLILQIDGHEVYNWNNKTSMPRVLDNDAQFLLDNASFVFQANESYEFGPIAVRPAPKTAEDKPVAKNAAP